MAPHGDMADMDMSGVWTCRETDTRRRRPRGHDDDDVGVPDVAEDAAVLDGVDAAERGRLRGHVHLPHRAGHPAAGLLALKSIQESRWLDQEFKRRYVAVQGKLPMAERVSADSLAKKMTLSENGVEEDVMVVKKVQTHARPWRLSVDPCAPSLIPLSRVLAIFCMFLLPPSPLTSKSIPELIPCPCSMLAVMTMNVGYFLSVLGGVFVGSLLVGRYTVTSEH
ncbi:uncharacterized protein PG998_001401 [Apiospora kogelbergensis]|uniref:uncharacterized protein n=1 Tax=Apiospora kogelbergensis TaxID=1337665 RepID=UPI00312EB19E